MTKTQRVPLTVEEEIIVLKMAAESIGSKTKPSAIKRIIKAYGDMQKNQFDCKFEVVKINSNGTREVVFRFGEIKEK